MKIRSNRFPIKGFREGLLIKLGDGNWDDILSVLIQQINERQEFFAGAKIAVDVGERELKAAELGKLRDQLSGKEITLFAILSESAATRIVSETLGLYTEKTLFNNEKKRDISANLSGGEDALLIRKSIRSGTLVKYPGHIVIDGDVNPGAEIQAEKSIYIWGTFRGSAHAGAKGSEEEIICALNFSSPKLRIANIALSEDSLSKKFKKKPKMAFIEMGEIIIRDWETRK